MYLNGRMRSSRGWTAWTTRACRTSCALVAPSI